MPEFLTDSARIVEVSRGSTTVKRKAALAVASRARNAGDAAQSLDMLGLDVVETRGRKVSVSTQ